MPTPLTMTPASVSFASLRTYMPTCLEDAVAPVTKHYSKFPALWTPSSPSPGLTVRVTNNSHTAAIAPILVDAVPDPLAPGQTSYVLHKEMQTVQPGEVKPCAFEVLPVSQMLLVLLVLGVDASEASGPGSGFSVGVEAWKL